MASTQTKQPVPVSLYVRRMLDKGALLLSSGFFGVAGLIAAALCILSVAAVAMTLHRQGMNEWLFADFLFVTVLLAYGTLFLFRLAIRSAREAAAIDPGEPTKQLHAAHLPPETSLVRASQEPPIDTSQILLRGAQAQPYTPAEELLRPPET